MAEGLGVVALPKVAHVESSTDKSLGQVHVIDSVKNENVVKMLTCVHF